MSDLEAPEVGMVRDQGSVDAARATLRPEESRPGLDPDTPARPLTPRWTMGHGTARSPRCKGHWGRVAASRAGLREPVWSYSPASHLLEAFEGRVLDGGTGDILCTCIIISPA